MLFLRKNQENSIQNNPNFIFVILPRMRYNNTYDGGN